MVLFSATDADIVRSLRIFLGWLAVLLGGGVLIWLLWLILGRAIALSLDHYFLTAGVEQPTDPLSINATEFSIGSRRWPLPRKERFKLKFTVDERKHLYMWSHDEGFALGAIVRTWPEAVEPQYQFSPEVGDTVTFARSTSRFVWPASPFHFSIMGAESPTWRRHVYDRLTWRKVSGAILKITWRDEQWFHARRGWSDTNTNQLANVIVQRSPYEVAVVEYLNATKGWSPQHYHLEWASANRDGFLVNVVVLSDASASKPGSGKSVLLYLDRAAGRVTKESAFQ